MYNFRWPSSWKSAIFLMTSQGEWFAQFNILVRQNPVALMLNTSLKLHIWSLVPSLYVTLLLDATAEAMSSSTCSPFLWIWATAKVNMGEAAVHQLSFERQNIAVTVLLLAHLHEIMGHQWSLPGRHGEHCFHGGPQMLTHGSRFPLLGTLLCVVHDGKSEFAPQWWHCWPREAEAIQHWVDCWPSGQLVRVVRLWKVELYHT